MYRRAEASWIGVDRGPEIYARVRSALTINHDQPENLMKLSRVVYTLVTCSILALGGCCWGHPGAENLIEAGIAVNRGHAQDEALTEESRLIGQDAWDAFEVLRYALLGEPLSPEVAARVTTPTDGQ
jgi:hypothetical protein